MGGKEPFACRFPTPTAKKSPNFRLGVCPITNDRTTNNSPWQTAEGETGQAGRQLSGSDSA